MKRYSNKKSRWEKFCNFFKYKLNNNVLKVIVLVLAIVILYNIISVIKIQKNPKPNIDNISNHTQVDCSLENNLTATIDGKEIVLDDTPTTITTEDTTDTVTTEEEKDDVKIEKTKQIEKPLSTNYKEFNAIVSYYTYLPSSTGSGSGITANGNKVSETSLAIPRNDDILRYGVKVEFDYLAPQYMIDYDGKYLTRIADDTGSPKHIRKIDNNTYKLDVFCPRLPKESDDSYHKRVYGYGITKTKMKIFN